MPATDTPPASPSVVREDPDEGEEPLDAADAIEVIDLDEGEDMEDDEEDDEDGDPDDLDASMQGQAASDASASASRLEAPPEDNATLTFSEHGNSVFCCDLNPKEGSQTLVVTGGEDDRAFVWDYTNGEILLKCEGFKDSVVHAGFSHGGDFLAAADMSGLIRVWKMASKEKVWEFETSDITWLSWHPGANVLFCTTVDSELWMWKLPSGDSKVFSGHGERAEAARVLPDGRRAAVGYGDGSARVFDLKSGEVTHSVGGKNSHSAAVASMDAKRDNNLLATGGVDGVARIYSLQASKGIAAFMCGSGGSSSSENKPEGEEDGGGDGDVSSKATVEAVLFSEAAEQNLLVTGSLEGVVNVWDISSQVSRVALNVGSGVVKMSWRKGGSGSELLVATLDGLVRLVDVRLGKVLADCSGHTEAILDFAQSKDGTTVITTSDDGKSKVFDLAKIIAEK